MDRRKNKIVDSLLYRIKHLCRETWENDEDFTTHYFLDNVSLTQQEMETIRELVK